MKCPHCDTAFHEDEDSWADNTVIVPQREEGPYWVSETVDCPECAQVIVFLGTSKSESETPTNRRMIYPSSVVPKVSTDVPEALRLDYIEAHQVWPISAKCSAAMSRRILQSILREQGYNDKNLHDQIQKILAEMDPDKILPSGLDSLIKAVHKFGNFSAHPITDTTTLQIINVDPAEAEWCIDIIGDLFDHFYVRPAMAAKRLCDLDQKLQQAGIAPIGP